MITTPNDPPIVHGSRGLEGEHLQQLPRVEAAMGAHAHALLRAMATAVGNIDQLSDALAEAFDQHPDAAIIISMPGLGPVLGARCAPTRRDRG